MVSSIYGCGAMEYIIECLYKLNYSICLLDPPLCPEYITAYTNTTNQIQQAWKSHNSLQYMFSYHSKEYVWYYGQYIRTHIHWDMHRLIMLLVILGLKNASLLKKYKQLENKALCWLLMHLYCQISKDIMHHTKWELNWPSLYLDDFTVSICSLW